MESISHQLPQMHDCLAAKRPRSDIGPETFQGDRPLELNSFRSHDQQPQNLQNEGLTPIFVICNSADRVKSVGRLQQASDSLPADNPTKDRYEISPIFDESVNRRGTDP